MIYLNVESLRVFLSIMDATADDKQDDNVEKEDDVNFSSDEAVGIPWLKYTAPGFLKIPHRLGPQLGLSSRKLT